MARHWKQIACRGNNLYVISYRKDLLRNEKKSQNKQECIIQVNSDAVCAKSEGLICKLLGIFSIFFQAIDIAQEVREGYYTSLFACH